MRVLILFFAALFAALAGELKIATYNVENLFDGVTQGSEYGDFKGNAWNASKYEKKRKAIAAVIKDLDADVLCLNEIENEGVLRDLAAQAGYAHFQFATLDRNSPVGLGVISRLPLEKTTVIPIYNERIFFVREKIKTRPILRAQFKFENEEISLFCAHFPAMKNRKEKREAAANAMKKAVKGAKNAVILGDLNSPYEPRHKFLLSDVEGFRNLWSELPTKRERRSYVGGGAIDHILLSNDFFGGSNLKYKNASFGVWRPKNDADKHKYKSEVSDHYPIFVTIEK